MHDPIFQDRQDAGLQLAAALEGFRDSDPLVLALPRGGVPVAFEIACALDAELNLVFVRKLGAPGYPEVGIGAVVDGADPQLVLNEAVVRQIAPDRDYVEAEYRRQLAEIERRRKTYAGSRAPVSAAGRTVIVVDDGIATGGTVRAALQALGKTGPARLVLAVPLAPADVVEALTPECDEIVCLAMPEPFHAVGAHYGDFTQTSDEEVVSLLDRAAVFAEGPVLR
jgi:putative phosphoribosyl transferase